MVFNLKKILKALLFSTSEPLSIRDIQAVITRYHEQADDEPEEEPIVEGAPQSGESEQVELDGIMRQVPSLLTATQIRDGMDAIAQELIDKDDVYRLVQGPAGYRLTTAPEYADWVRLFRKEPKPMKLSQAAMETLAIIAYRQPVTRAEMEAIRGVSIDSALNKLLELELAHIVGRADLPGRPIQYGTADKFLEYTGTRSIEELPASDVLSSGQITEWIRKATNREEPISDTDVGLPASEPIPEDSSGTPELLKTSEPAQNSDLDETTDIADASDTAEEIEPSPSS
ncbi:SMC-Scp complex subunit ScpB [Rubellicoccus peritrichatus]|uniref:SMC-Scp complex subunit ScpB n=1 Tax=Rubellicoccus peritrichatus TaxID=3080537 RepID=A0AAQ3LAB7_9BACT|nr:SMC-Scp complex subunit ScpB [Puniceicoccus sp. CR14]WOO41592.1 SMC-Scp complex subunit ScpB [Puniceicoccus sp. CR14]